MTDIKTRDVVKGTIKTLDSNELRNNISNRIFLKMLDSVFVEVTEVK